MDILETEGRASLQQQRSFLYEIVPSVTGGGKGLVKIIRGNLVRGRPIAAEEFRCTLNVIGLILLWGPKLVHFNDSKGGYSDILTTMAAAVQRYECHRCTDIITDSDYEAAEVPNAVIMLCT